ncbi:nucleotidyltransferase [Allofustis seminis]|uniref:nucleotidyltransferase n=1 Tax=Allofustis seminis TaxID=166939 RepID=UPI000363832B|nr:nucleotidyltransferase [Allofustis seminis]
MSVWGIVAEYHPFHNGHQYQIDWIRQQDREAIIIAVMSGNFMQRGIPALMDKWMRTEMTLAAGIDLVMELPIHFAIQAADFFARGGLSVLTQLEIDHLVFGCESGMATDFQNAAEVFLDQEHKIFQKVRENSKSQAYPEALQAAIMQSELPITLDLTTSNNRLGFSYAKEIVSNHLDVKMHPLERIGTSHFDQRLIEGKQYASGTAIRQALLKKEDIHAFVPKSTFQIIAQANANLITWKDFWPYLKYQLIVSSIDSLQMIYQMNNGLEYLLKDAARKADTYAQFLEYIKTKAYTQARLERLALYGLLRWNGPDMISRLNEKANLRVLGFSELGRSYLKLLRRKGIRPDTIIGKVESNTYALDIQAGEIYRLAKPTAVKIQDYTRNPVQRR